MNRQFLLENLKNGIYRNVVVLTGAGVSTGAGIPDFRSPGGMYDSLRPELITATPKQRKRMQEDPTEVVGIPLFTENQFPYLEVRRPFILGTFANHWKATLSHFFFRVLSDKGILRRLYSQNIDGLDLQAGLPSDTVVNVHGSLREICCEFCKTPYPVEKFNHQLETQIRDIYDPNDTKQSANIWCENHLCRRAGIKPNTVMYGTQLPDKFFQACRDDFPAPTDLLIVAGTSLTVGPANQLVHMVDHSTPRLIVNLEPVGVELGIDYSPNAKRDIFSSGPCDREFLFLAQELGWIAELREYRDLMCPESQELLDSLEEFVP